MKDQVKEKTKKRPTLNDDERQRIVADWANGDMAFEDVRDMPIIKMVTGRASKPSSLIGRREVLALAPDSDRFTGDAAHRRGIAKVIAPEMYEWIGLYGAHRDHSDREKRFFDRLLGLLPRYCHKPEFIHFSVLAESLKGDHELLKDSELSKRDKAILDACRTVMWEILPIGDQRKLFMGRSASAYGWTDGQTFVGIDISHARSVQKGLDGIGEVVHTLMHEACHVGTVTLAEHDHDQDFFERFHDLAMGQGYFARQLLAYLLRRFRSQKIAINRKLMAVADLHQQAVGHADESWMMQQGVSPAVSDNGSPMPARARACRKGRTRTADPATPQEPVPEQMMIAL